MPVPPGLAEQLAGPDGPQRLVYRRGAALHRRCTSGRELLRWIGERHGVGTQVARGWAQALMRGGRLRHVFDDRPFSGGRQLFRVL
jgi:hypothetical protein